MSDFAFMIIETSIKAVFVVLIFSALAGYGTYIERRILAFIQRRKGPMHVGPFGLLQIVADGIKMFTKENIIPSRAIKPIFFIAPLITASTAFIAMSAVPFGPSFELFGHTVKPIVSDMSVGVLFVLGVMASGFYGPLLGGIASSNKYSLLGGARTAIQLISYEVVSGLALLGPILLVGSLSLISLNDYQAGGLFDWTIFKQPLAFALFMIAGFAETNRTPFDLMEHEAEVVVGYATEYSGIHWGLFAIGEYANMFTISFVISLVFLGGYNDFYFIPGAIALLCKVAFFFFFFILVRGAWPHVRPDQLTWLCWKILMPLAVVNILIAAVAIL
jgi:NADH-quinone oxidoreductase subunit H